MKYWKEAALAALLLVIVIAGLGTWRAGGVMEFASSFPGQAMDLVRSVVTLLLRVLFGLLFYTALAVVLVQLYPRRLYVLLYPFYPLANTLAKRNKFFTVTKEGTAKVVVRGGAFDHALIQWQGYTFDYKAIGLDRWRVVEGEEPPHPLGGLRFYGLWPLKDIGFYRLRWWDLHMTEEGEEKPTFHEETLYHVNLRTDVYWVEVRDVETKPPERLRVSVEFLITMRPINPRRLLFVAPIGWVENATTRLVPHLTSFVTQRSLDELLEAQAHPEQMWAELGQLDLVRTTFLLEWGVQIEEEGIEIRAINLPPEVQQAAEAQRIAELEAKAARQRTEIGAEAEALRIERVWGKIQDFGDLGKLIRTLEAAEKSPLAASLTIQSVPGLAEVLRGVFGKPTEDILVAEIQALRKALDHLSQQIVRQGGQTT